MKFQPFNYLLKKRRTLYHAKKFKFFMAQNTIGNLEPLFSEQVRNSGLNSDQRLLIKRCNLFQIGIYIKWNVLPMHLFQNVPLWRNDNQFHRLHFHGELSRFLLNHELYMTPLRIKQTYIISINRIIFQGVLTGSVELNP